MDKKKGAGGKPQEFDPKTGEYGEQTQVNEIISRLEKTVGKIFPLSRTEYGTLRAEVIQKQSQRGYRNMRDYAYTANAFYVFDNGSELGGFRIRIKLDIDGNKDIIDQIWRWLDKNG